MIIGFANGCFDLLHDGHRQLLSCAREMVDRLVVGINDDEAVRLLKGEGRPVESLPQRIARLWATGSCSEIMPFSSEDGLERLIAGVRPDFYFRGEDQYDRALPKSVWPAMAIYIPMVEGVSTTKIIEARA